MSMMNTRASVGVALLLMGLSPFGWAQGNGVPAGEADPNAPAGADVETEKKADATDWKKLGFGAGVGVSFLGDSNIKEAVVQNGIIRVTDEEEVRRGLWLETHYQWNRWGRGERFAWGPFLGVQVGGEGGLFDSVGAGLILAMNRNPNASIFKNSAFNIGYGVASSTVRVLGDGLKRNEAMPDGEESIRYRKKDDLAHLVIFSFTFSSGADDIVGQPKPDEIPYGPAPVPAKKAAAGGG